jgi:hypothetical protein
VEQVLGSTGRTYPKIPAGRSATVRRPPLPFASKTAVSAFALESLYASIGTSGNAMRSSTSLISPPLNTTPAELVNTSLRTPVSTAAAMMACVPSTFTLWKIAGSFSVACGEAVWMIHVVPLYQTLIMRMCWFEEDRRNALCARRTLQTLGR